jgi:hypothetical protein
VSRADNRHGLIATCQRNGRRYDIPLFRHPRHRGPNTSRLTDCRLPPLYGHLNSYAPAGTMVTFIACMPRRGTSRFAWQATIPGAIAQAIVVGKRPDRSADRLIRTVRTIWSDPRSGSRISIVEVESREVGETLSLRPSLLPPVGLYKAQASDGVLDAAGAARRQRRPTRGGEPCTKSCRSRRKSALSLFPSQRGPTSQELFVRGHGCQSVQRRSSWPNATSAGGYDWDEAECRR